MTRTSTCRFWWRQPVDTSVLPLRLRLRLSLSHSHTPFSSSAAAWHHPGVERLQEGVLLTLTLT